MRYNTLFFGFYRILQKKLLLKAAPGIDFGIPFRGAGNVFY
jgi:hypothetical protein